MHVCFYVFRFYFKIIENKWIMMMVMNSSMPTVFIEYDQNLKEKSFEDFRKSLN
jgi:hypothetical protein